MAILNCVEISNQNKLFNILPKLCKNLANKFMDTLAEFGVKWTHVNMGKLFPQSDLDQLILGAMCKQASKGVELQCKREYWGENSEARATAIHMLTAEERKGLPTNNLNAERYLAKFGYLASQSAQHSNKLFKAKRIKDDLMLIDSNEDIQKTRVQSSQNPARHGGDLDSGLKTAKQHRLRENLKKIVRAKYFIDQLFARCKEHGGPVTSTKELQSLVQRKSPDLKVYLRKKFSIKK
jgi:hypothetical protein